MAKKSMWERYRRCSKLIEQYREKRASLKKTISSAADYDARLEAQLKLSKLPRNSNPVRLCSRCEVCHRARAVYKKFGLCRLCLRKKLMDGDVAGGRKSSW